MAAADPTPTLSPATLHALELPALLAVIAQLAATDLGRQRIEDLTPFAREGELNARRIRFEETQRLLQGGRLVPSFGESLLDVLERLENGRPLQGIHLNRLAAALRITRQARERVQEADPPCPSLLADVEALPDCEELRRKIDKTLDARGEVREDASPELVRLRGRIRRVRDSLYSELQNFIQENRAHLSEETIPMRDGRLVLTLQAGGRGQLPGLIHGRSATRKSFYFEPLQVVETNNQLQQYSDDENAERQRLLVDLVRSASQALPELLQHADFLGQLDLLQASADYARLTDGRLAALAPGDELRLLAARHPLLDPALAELRLEALGQAGHRGDVVPLNVELGARRHCMVVTGPNAGGKTIALKTVGLLALCNLCGLPVPAAAGSRLPLLTHVIAIVGDEQDLLTDRSTFSARLLRFKEVWQEAGPATLVLLDELGSGTDPVEGAALAVTLLEALAGRGSLAIMTTHLVQLAAAALELEGACCAAMELDTSGQPTFQLVVGPPGGSEALTLARRLGLPKEWLDRAERQLSPEHRDLRRLLIQVEKSRQQLAEQQARLEADQQDATKLLARLETERQELTAERKRLGTALRRQLDDFQQQTARRLREEMSRLQEEYSSGRRKGLEGQALKRLFSEAPVFREDEPEPAGPLKEGSPVQHRSLGWKGTLEKLDRGRAEVLVQGKRLRCREEELVAIGNEPAAEEGRARSRRSQAVRLAEAADDLPVELNLIGQRVEPALEALDSYLDQALLASRPEVRVVHGHGSGRLREAVRDHLRQHVAVSRFRPGEPSEGGNGATIAQLRG